MVKTCYIRKGVAYKFEDEPEFENFQEFSKDLQKARITNLGEDLFPEDKLIKREVYSINEVDYILVDQGNEEDYSGETKLCCDICDLDKECMKVTVGLPCGCEFSSNTLYFCKKV